MTQERPVRVQQADADGCGVAVLAMLTGQTYAQVDAEWPLRLTGHWKHSDVKPHMMRDYLWKHGYSLRVIRDRRYAAGGAWPSIRPFAPMHYAMVDSPTQPTGHWIAIDAEGTVLDPFDGSRTTLAAYAKMHEVVGVWPALGAVAASPDEEWEADRFRLDMADSEIDALPLPPWKKVILRELAGRGGYFLKDESGAAPVAAGEGLRDEDLDNAISAYQGVVIANVAEEDQLAVKRRAMRAALGAVGVGTGDS